MKSRAPRRIASTASSTLPHAVITMTGRLLSSATISREKVQAFLTRSGVARVVQIDQQRVVRIRCQCLPDLSGRLGAIHPITLGMKQQLESLENMRLIVRRENPWGAVCRADETAPWNGAPCDFAEVGMSYGEDVATVPVTAS